MSRADTPPMLPIDKAEQLMLELVHLALPGVYRRRDALRLDLGGHADHVELRLRKPGVDPTLPPDCSAILTHRHGESTHQWCTTAAEAVLMMRGILDEHGGDEEGGE
jgi:hypothetical protein